jgi:hypothetical protein
VYDLGNAIKNASREIASEGSSRNDQSVHASGQCGIVDEKVYQDMDLEREREGVGKKFYQDMDREKGRVGDKVYRNMRLEKVGK